MPCEIPYSPEICRMKMILRAGEAQAAEWQMLPLVSEIAVIRVTQTAEFSEYPDAAVYVDLLFLPNEENAAILRQLNAPVLLHLLPLTLDGFTAKYGLEDKHIVAINGWPGFINRPVIETVSTRKDECSEMFSRWGLKSVTSPDVPGMISARIIAMIINEAFFALEEGVSTKAEIDTAMKLGTNYPFGPFEWSEKIGLTRICHLLETIALSDARYQPAPAMKQEAL